MASPKERTGKQLPSAPAKDNQKAKLSVPAKVQTAEEQEEKLIRLFGYDLYGSKKVSIGLMNIKGVSWSISHALCHILKIPSDKRIADLTKDEMKKIEETLMNLPVPAFLKNRRSDPETGKTEHLYASDLDMRKEFDIKRLKEIKSYKGMRHALHQPVRGQRTRSHFRKKSQAALRRKK